MSSYREKPATSHSVHSQALRRTALLFSLLRLRGLAPVPTNRAPFCKEAGFGGRWHGISGLRTTRSHGNEQCVSVWFGLSLALILRNVARQRPNGVARRVLPRAHRAACMVSRRCARLNSGRRWDGQGWPVACPLAGGVTLELRPQPLLQLPPSPSPSPASWLSNSEASR